MFRVVVGIWYAAVFGAALAQSYPNRPVRLIMPVAAGSSTSDILGRALAQRLSDTLGQQVVVDNRPGASGNIGSQIAAFSPADGYTMLLGYTSAHAISPNVYKNLGYDPVRDLAPVAQFAIVPYALVINPGVAATNLRELIALAKARPGQLNIASSGTGTLPHMAGELLKLAAGIDITHIPYKSGSLAAIDVLGGHVQMYFSGVTSMGPLIKSGKLRGIAVSTLVRSSLLPEVPTAEEAGLAGFDVSAWQAVFVPAKTPSPIIRRLYDEIAHIINSQETKGFLATQGAEPALQTPAQFAVTLKAELAKWAKVVKAANITPDQ